MYCAKKYFEYIKGLANTAVYCTYNKFALIHPANPITRSLQSHRKCANLAHFQIAVLARKFLSHCHHFWAAVGGVIFQGALSALSVHFEHRVTTDCCRLLRH